MASAPADPTDAQTDSNGGDQRDDRAHEPVRTSEKYGSLILQHSKRSRLRHYHTGLNYRALAKFLEREPQPVSPTQGRTDSHDFLVIRTFARERGERSTRTYTANDVHRFEQAPSEKNISKVIFMRGLASRAWLNALGNHYRLDPEFFRRHLEFTPSIDYHDLPSVPSVSRRMVTIRVSTIFRRRTALPRIELQHARQGEDLAVRKYQREVDRHGGIGTSIVRGLSFQNETTFTLEQAMTICAVKQDDDVRVIVWMDAGLHLDSLNATRTLTRCGSGDLECAPIFQHRYKIALQTFEDAPESGGTFREPSTQSFANLAYHYGATLDPKAVPLDTIYALSELFSFAAHANCQLMNLLQAQITKTTKSFREDMESALKELDYLREMVKDRQQNIAEVKSCIEGRGDPKWPRADLALETCKTLLTDWDYLHRRCESLTAQCTEGANMIANAALLEESKKSMSQQKKVSKLTLLAFFFLPLQLATGVCGMNFKEFGQGERGIWWFPVILIPILAVALILLFWDGLTPLLRHDQRQQTTAAEQAEHNGSVSLNMPQTWDAPAPAPNTSATRRSSRQTGA